ncbi:MAG TPA: M23 family metallopeptidase [Gemmatimonadota bacterium]|nr:M23 family metallopeptidase [Gemmatimonadota bacterium]
MNARFQTLIVGFTGALGFALGAAATLYLVTALFANPFEPDRVLLEPAAEPIPDDGPAEPPLHETPPEPMTLMTIEAARTASLSADSADALIRTLRARGLIVPVQGVKREDLADHFDDPRGGDRVHYAIDIAAPPDTPVLAVGDGRIAKLYLSNGGGGIAIYQFDSTATFGYYYAHLSRYSTDLAEGAFVRRGDVIGYVGTTGNAPPDVPHLHFGITLLTPEKRWWQGVPLNPYRALR